MMKSTINQRINSLLRNITVLFMLMFSVLAMAETEIMNNDRLDQLIKRFDQHAAGKPGFWQITYDNMQVLIITDEKANRMRIITQITDVKELTKEHLYRLMQANFDSALDARYAIAKDAIWSTFLHPLGSLTEKDFYSGLAQVITLATTFGSSFSSGALMFNGGDSQEQQRQLYESLLKKGLST